jgi:hypothetical protein
MNPRPLIVLATVALTSGILALPPAVGTPAATHTRVISSCTTSKYKPHQYVLACADANTQIHHATYSSWRGGRAVGRGTFVYNTCLPSCADGTFKHHPVTFSLGRARNVGGKRLFTRMYVSYAGLTETFDLPTSPV